MSFMFIYLEENYRIKYILKVQKRLHITREKLWTSLIQFIKLSRLFTYLYCISWNVKCIMRDFWWSDNFIFFIGILKPSCISVVWLFLTPIVFTFFYASIVWILLNINRNGNIWKLANVFVRGSCLVAESMDCSPPSSSVHGLFQARMLE